MSGTSYQGHQCLTADEHTGGKGGGDGDGMSTGVIAGIAIGTILVVAGVSVGIYFAVKKHKTSKKK
jgi:hypothetical protein